MVGRSLGAENVFARRLSKLQDGLQQEDRQIQRDGDHVLRWRLSSRMHRTLVLALSQN